MDLVQDMQVNDGVVYLSTATELKQFTALTLDEIASLSVEASGFDLQNKRAYLAAGPDGLLTVGLPE